VSWKRKIYDGDTEVEQGWMYRLIVWIELTKVFQFLDLFGYGAPQTVLPKVDDFEMGQVTDLRSELSG